jgi:predicted RNase H-like HicB family nuclease
MKNNAYVAHGEDPILVCAYGKTPGKAMKELGKLIDKYIKQDDDYLVLGMNSSYDEDGVFCMNATISAWR